MQQCDVQIPSVFSRSHYSHTILMFDLSISIQQDGESNSDSGRWSEMCTGYWSQDECLRPTDENGSTRCQWTPAPDDFDCSQLWPTDAPEAGCCAGNTQYSVGMCHEYDSSVSCETMASCHWLIGEYADCTWTGSTTTGSPVQSGCCTLSDSQDPGSGWAERCPDFWTEHDCIAPMDGFGQHRCGWMDTDPYFDCC